MKSTLVLLVSTVTMLVGCSGASGPDGGKPAPTTTTSASAASSVSSVAPPALSTSVAALPSAAPPVPLASAAVLPAPSASAAVAPPVEEVPMPKVTVKNIGMHIGGGPNDDVTKAPIHRSVEPHFDEFRRCFAKVEDQKKGGDFGVDLLIEGKGGKAQVTHPRTALKGEGFKACVVAVYEAIEFLHPKGSKKTMVSYSIRFTP